MTRAGSDDEERLDRLVRAMGGRGVTQLVVRGERLYERGKRRLKQRPLALAPTLRADQLRPVRFIDDLSSGGRRTRTAQLPSALSGKAVVAVRQSAR